MKLPLEAYLWSAGLVLMLWSTAGGKLAFQKSLLSSHFFSYLDFGWLYRPVMLFTSDIFHLFTECAPWNRFRRHKSFDWPLSNDTLLVNLWLIDGVWSEMSKKRSSSRPKLKSFDSLFRVIAA